MHAVRLATVALGTLLVLLVFAAYQPVTSAGFIWDDDEYVVDNRNLDDWQGLKRIWLEPRSSPQYYPLVFTSFWIERHAFGTGPGPLHVVNILLHAASALLLWAVLRRLSVPGAYAAALVFAVHPVHVESVAWITERKNVLSGLLYLSSALAYLSFALGRREGLAPAWSRPAYWAALLLFVCALLSKSVTATLPAALLLVLWWKQGRLEWRDVAPALPFFAIGATLGIATAWLEVHHVGAQGPDWSLPLIDRVLRAARAVWFYAGTLAWPHPLMFVYPKWRIDARAPIDYLPLALLLGAVGALWAARRRAGTGPLVAVLVFLVTLSPALGLLNVYPMRYSWVADHFQYLASIGLIVLATAVIAGLARTKPRRAAVWMCAAVAVVAFVAVARAEGRKYRDLETLWSTTRAQNGDAWIAHVNLGNLRMQAGRYAEARALYLEALRVEPNLAEAHNNLGTASFRTGDYLNAVDHHRRAIALSPRYVEAHNNLGIALGRLQRTPEAIRAFEEAIRIEPSYAMAHYNLGNALTRMGDAAAAERHYLDAIRFDPHLAMAHYALGMRMLERRAGTAAANHLSTAFRLRPDFAAGYLEAGNVLLRQGDARGAIGYYQQAIARKPDYAEAHSNIGSALMQQGDRAAAVAHLERALQLRPDYAIAHNNLGFALETAGRYDEAVAHYVAALRLEPTYATARENLRRVQRNSGRPPRPR